MSCLARHVSAGGGAPAAVAALGLCLTLSAAAALPAADTPSASVPGDYVCGPMLEGSARFLVAMLDPFTGLPYDQLRCQCRWPSAGGVCQSAGVLPQLADAEITPFAQSTPAAVDWRFVDDLAGAGPTLLYALELAVHLSPTNQFGGLIWGATADVSRYDRLRIRYRTATPASTFELKLNSGLSDAVREQVVHLPGSPADGSWRDETFTVATDFAGTDAAHLNYLVVATSLGLAGGPEATLWVDHLAFLADPARAADCSVTIDCGDDPNCYPDLSRYEPFTGAVNVANALAVLTLLPEAGLLSEVEAEGRVATILASLGATPRVDGWMQDWHSPVSLMPLSTNRVGSLTDLPQLYAALMVVEESRPALAATASALRSGMFDLSDLFDRRSDGGCPGELHWAKNLCTGREPGVLEYFGNDALLGEFLAVATGAAPPDLWSGCLSRKGCELRGQAGYRWYTTGAFSCGTSVIPAAETGGPFLQLAPITYLDADRLPIGGLSIADSAAAMLAAQRDWAAGQGLAVWGWANQSDAASCDYLTCERFTPEVATPYVCGMGLALPQTGLAQSCAENLAAFDALGASAPLDTGTVAHDFGLRDAWNQATRTSRQDGYLYLDTGWLALGALNACHGELVRRRFAAHPVAVAGYASLAGLGLPCPVEPTVGR